MTEAIKCTSSIVTIKAAYDNTPWKDKSDLNRVERFKKLTKSQTVLVGASDFVSNIRPREFKTYFEETPVIRALEDCRGAAAAAASWGVVSVLYVPKGLGKTTAARVFLKGCGQYGISFVPENEMLEDDYISNFQEALEVKQGASNASEFQWVKDLIKGMNNAVTEGGNTGKGTKKGAHLLLDEFTCEQNGGSGRQFIMAFKQCLREYGGANVRVIVLTGSKECADYILTLNGHAGITSMHNCYDRHSKEWVSMIWPEENLVLSVLKSIQREGIKDVSEGEIREAFDELKVRIRLNDEIDIVNVNQKPSAVKNAIECMIDEKKELQQSSGTFLDWSSSILTQPSDLDDDIETWSWGFPFLHWCGN